MASKLRQRTRRKRSGGSRGSRRSGIASVKRQASANRARRQASQRQADQNRGIAAARTSGFRERNPQPQLSGRDAAIRRASQGTTQRGLEQSVGSLDRRVQSALSQGNTALAKDLRSRQNRFVKDLARKRAQGSMLSSAPLSQRDAIRKRINANPNVIVGQNAFDVFQNTIDQDFLDPTRKLQNEFPDQYQKMYPIASRLQAGPPTVQAIKGMFGIKNKPIPYSQPDMPGVRYPLDRTPDAVQSSPDATQSLRNIPEGYDSIYSQMFLEQPETRARGIDTTRNIPDREAQVKASEGIAGVLKGIDTTRNIPDMEDALKAQDLAGRAVPPISQRQPGVGATPMSMSDVADMQRMNAIRNQIATNTGILANLPQGIDPTQVGSIQGSGGGLQSVFNMQDFVDRNPGSVFPTGYNLGMLNNDFDTGLQFYGGNTAFGNTPEARAALEALRSNDPQSFINMLGGVGIGGLR